MVSWLVCQVGAALLQQLQPGDPRSGEAEEIGRKPRRMETRSDAADVRDNACKRVESLRKPAGRLAVVSGAN